MPIQSGYVSNAGRITIPANLRKEFELKRGTKVVFEAKGDEIVMRPVNARFYDRCCGILKGGGLTKALLTSRREDKKREERKLSIRKNHLKCG